MLEPGQSVNWLQTQRGGYGFTRSIKAEVVKVTAKRVQIRVWKPNGDPVLKFVKPESIKTK